jgi:hypothetical protein
MKWKHLIDNNFNILIQRREHNQFLFQDFVSRCLLPVIGCLMWINQGFIRLSFSQCLINLLHKRKDLEMSKVNKADINNKGFYLDYG